jgi:hypothetical protein
MGRNAGENGKSKRVAGRDGKGWGEWIKEEKREWKRQGKWTGETWLGGGRGDRDGGKGGKVEKGK